MQLIESGYLHIYLNILSTFSFHFSILSMFRFSSCRVMQQPLCELLSILWNFFFLGACAYFAGKIVHHENCLQFLDDIQIVSCTKKLIFALFRNGNADWFIICIVVYINIDETLSMPFYNLKLPLFTLNLTAFYS